MRPGKTKNEPVSGILLLAKQSGQTSFSSLWTVKHALSTGKVGHTGTLDSFADGLLVVLTGKLTRLVPHITSFDKDYLAVICFGSETDTLDPTGRVVKTSACPSEEALRAVLPKFTGKITQIPPAYSAVHIDGKRASDIARSGKTAEIPSREVTIHSITLLDFTGKYALLEISCSKGTYIRSLARDIAESCGSCAHLAALRRMSVGPFRLKDAVGADRLEDFTISAVEKKLEATSVCVQSDVSDGDNEAEILKKYDESDSSLATEIVSGVMPLTPDIASLCGFSPAVLSADSVFSFINGQPLSFSSFLIDAQYLNSAHFAVFYPDGVFAGVVDRNGKHFSYGFVIPRQKKSFSVFSWDQIVSGKFNEEYKNQGTALTIGSFDGPHIGHESLFNAVLAQAVSAPGFSPLVPGVVTFRRSLRGLKDPASYKGDVATLSQRLEVVERKGFAFAVVIDFSSDFGKIEGTDFLSVLVRKCGMRFLAEGRDFHCGHLGAVDMESIQAFSEEQNFLLQSIDPVLYKNNRVSSSLIRENILAGRFAPAEYMLNRPFAIDCTGFEWKIENSCGEDVLTAAKRGIQVWPPEGIYNVMLILSGGGVSAAAQTFVCAHTYNALCKIGSCDLRLQVPENIVNGCVRAIQFSDPTDLL